MAIHFLKRQSKLAMNLDLRSGFMTKILILQVLPEGWFRPLCRRWLVLDFELSDKPAGFKPGRRSVLPSPGKWWQLS